MGLPERTQANDRLLAWGIFLLVLALYVPYFFLPVMEVKEPILGREGLILCILIPFLWPILLGHLALWIGAVCLLSYRWRAACIAGIVALVVSFQSWQIMLIGRFPGQYMKFASMIALVAGALIEAYSFRFGEKKGDVKTKN